MHFIGNITIEPMHAWALYSYSCVYRCICKHERSVVKVLACLGLTAVVATMDKNIPVSYKQGMRPNIYIYRASYNNNKQ